MIAARSTTTTRAKCGRIAPVTESTAAMSNSPVIDTLIVDVDSVTTTVQPTSRMRHRFVVRRIARPPIALRRLRLSVQASSDGEPGVGP